MSTANDVSPSGRFRGHHANISVRNLDASLDFYSLLGFRVAMRWSSRDGSLQIVHMVLGWWLLELFAYTANKTAQPLSMPVGNDLQRPGVRHIGLQTDDLDEARAFLLSRGCELSELRSGRTKIDFFYVKDPDGNWVEIVRDHRRLPDDGVLAITEAE